MNVLAILKDFTFRCKSVFENTTIKMSKRFLNWLILTIRTVALIPGKVNFTRLSQRMLCKNKYKIVNRQFYLINPHYEVKFGLKPRKLYFLLGNIPYIRNFLTTSCFYILSVNTVQKTIKMDKNEE